MAVLLEDGDTEAVEGVDIPGVVVPGELMDTLAHLIGGLVGKGDAEDVARQDAQLVDQIGKAFRKGARLARSRAGDDADKALGGRDRLPLGSVQALQKFRHPAPSLIRTLEQLFLL